MSLTRYHQKRDFNKTAEPEGDSAETGPQYLRDPLIYVVQKHAASHLHYDFRLAWRGVLKSWAVPKGPSQDPKEKRLAVEVEDHPIEYAQFEGTIPKGQYGGGTVEIWDRGTWEPLFNPDQGLKIGKLVFRLHGQKLTGEWTLLRMKTEGPRANWLLMKKQEERSQ